MSNELNKELKTTLKEMSKVCTDLAYYVENAHFDGCDIRRDEFDLLMAALPKKLRSLSEIAIVRTDY